VTALYEIVPAGEPVPSGSIDPLKYQRPSALTPAARSRELAAISVRYKAPDGHRSTPVAAVLADRRSALTPNIAFASAVAEFGLLLRQSRYAGRASFDAALQRAREFRGEDREGYRAEFAALIETAAKVSATARTTRY
jgi:Ca-activated chloride channel family protein